MKEREKKEKDAKKRKNNNNKKRDGDGATDNSIAVKESKKGYEVSQTCSSQISSGKENFEFPDGGWVCSQC